MSNALESLLEQLRAIAREEVRRVVREELDGRQTTPGAPELLSPKEAADLARVQPATIRAWVAAGTLTRYGAGRVLRVSRAELLEHLSPRQADAGNRSPEQAADELLRRRRGGRRRRAGGGHGG